MLRIVGHCPAGVRRPRYSPAPAVRGSGRYDSGRVVRSGSKPVRVCQQSHVGHQGPGGRAHHLVPYDNPYLNVPEKRREKERKTAVLEAKGKAARKTSARYLGQGPKWISSSHSIESRFIISIAVLGYLDDFYALYPTLLIRPIDLVLPVRIQY